MNVDILLGTVAVLIGTATVFSYILKRSSAKREAMRRAFGFKAGTAIHILGYILVPILLGIVLILKGLK